MHHALLSSMLLLGWSSGVQPEPKRKASPFEEMAMMVMGGAAIQNFEYGYVSDLLSWAALKGPEIAPLRGFPKKLLEALDSPRTKDHETALWFVQCYTALARTNAFERGQKDLEPAARRTFAPHTEAIRAALVKSLAAPELPIRWKAASSLLAFEPDNARANSILAEGFVAEDAKFREQACQMIGMLHLSSPCAVNGLIRGLRDKEPEVSHSAANAVRQIGREAKPAVPALIDLLKSGDAAYGRVDTPLAIALPRWANLALLALAEMGADAQPAVPAIIEMFRKANGQRAGPLVRQDFEEDEHAEKREFLTCLARIGPAAKEGIPTIEQAMKSDNTRLRVTAACAMLCVVPAINRVAAVANDALGSKDKKVRSQALKACSEVGPRSTMLVPALLSVLGDEDDDARIPCAYALGCIGPGAAEAIPALEKLLTTKEVTRDFLVRRAAAYALTRMGKASVPALIRATAQDSAGREDAICALGYLGKDAQPAAVECLIGILRSKDAADRGRFRAAIALGRLGEHARSARPILEAIRQHDEAMALVVELVFTARPTLEVIRSAVEASYGEAMTLVVGFALMEIPR